MNIQEFMNYVKECREESGLTQSEVADKLCVDRTTYAKLESGANLGVLNHLYNLAILFNISDETLLRLFQETSLYKIRMMVRKDDAIDFLLYLSTVYEENLNMLKKYGNDNPSDCPIYTYGCFFDETVTTQELMQKICDIKHEYDILKNDQKDVLAPVKLDFVVNYNELQFLKHFYSLGSEFITRVGSVFDPNWRFCPYDDEMFASQENSPVWINSERTNGYCNSFNPIIKNTQISHPRPNVTRETKTKYHAMLAFFEVAFSRRFKCCPSESSRLISAPVVFTPELMYPHR